MIFFFESSSQYSVHLEADGVDSFIYSPYYWPWRRWLSVEYLVLPSRKSIHHCENVEWKVAGLVPIILIIFLFPHSSSFIMLLQVHRSSSCRVESLLFRWLSLSSYVMMIVRVFCICSTSLRPIYCLRTRIAGKEIKCVCMSLPYKLDAKVYL